MTSEFTLLLLTAISVAFIHTLSGPDHYLPFIMIAKARKWSLAKTSWFTVLCGLGHVGGSIVLGFIGIAFGIALAKLEFFESVRGSLIAWLFTAFGLVYLAWAIYRVLRGKKHTHIHFHKNENMHVHEHNHHAEHMHIHDEKSKAQHNSMDTLYHLCFWPVRTADPDCHVSGSKTQLAPTRRCNRCFQHYHNSYHAYSCTCCLLWN